MTSTMEPIQVESPVPPRRDGWRRVVALTGVALIVGGLGVLAWVCWQYFGTNIVSEGRQDDARAELHRQWEDGKEPSAIGKGVALLRVPRFGEDYQMPIIKGVDDDSLASGIGWFPHTQRAGEVGNFALAAHRVTHGEPFRDFLELRKGDKVFVETRTHIYTYTLDDNGTDHEVPFTESWVVDPVPGKPNAEPTEALITLVTCSELFHTDNRSYVSGHLTNEQAKAEG